MKADDIYQVLKDHGHDASTIAEALGVRPQSVSGVIRDGYGSKRIAEAVALASGCQFEIMFPFYQEKSLKKANRAKKINDLRAKLGVV